MEALKDSPDSPASPESPAAIEDGNAEPLITVTFRDAATALHHCPGLLKVLQQAFSSMEVFCKDSTTIQLFETDTEGPKSLYQIDTTPANTATAAAMLPIRFRRNVAGIIDDAAGGEAEGGGRQALQACFNCGGGHNLRDCPEPKDPFRIAAARKQFSKAAASRPAGRYHSSAAGEDAWSARLQPGGAALSDGLRQALGLRPGQLPAHIYQMRVCGYPPGWMEEARRSDSQLQLIDFDGSCVAGRDTPPAGTIDADKIVSYPGFNTPPPEDCRDEYEWHCVPPFSAAFSKESMLAFIRRQEEENQREVAEKEEQKEDDKEEEVKQARDACSPSAAEAAAEETPPAQQRKRRPASPSLTDLVSQKRQLLEALSSEENDSNDDQGRSPTGRSVSLGTPILQSVSPYGRLPERANFSKDISQVIEFENLPNSTGAYQKLTDLLGKVRNTLRNLNNTFKS